MPFEPERLDDEYVQKVIDDILKNRDALIRITETKNSDYEGVSTRIISFKLLVLKEGT